MKSRNAREGHSPARKRGPVDLYGPDNRNRTQRKVWMRAYGYGPARQISRKERRALQDAWDAMGDCGIGGYGG
jgi:hypothetical protein